MTGTDICRMREALGLDLYVFAKLLAVHVSTVTRWEASTTPVTTHGYTTEILAKLQELRLSKRLGTAIRTAVIDRGALAGLQILLVKNR